MALSLKLDEGCWHVVGEAWGKPIRVNTGLPEDQREVAEFAMLGIEREAEAGFRADRRPIVILGNKTVAEAIRAYLAKKLKERGHQMSASVTRKFTKIEADFGHYKLSEINQDVVDEWIEARKIEGMKSSSMNVYLGSLTAVMRYAEEVGWIGGRVKLTIPKGKVYRDEHLSLKEIDKFLRVCIERHPAYFPTFLFMLDTGARRGEMMRLDWADVALEGDGTVQIKKPPPISKTRTRTIPLSPRLKNTLEALTWREGPVFRTPFGRPWVEHDMKYILLPVFRDCLFHAGIAEERKLTLHSLRHTFAFQCASYGMDIADISYLLGHNDLSTTMIYRAFVPDIGANTVERFGSALTGRKVTERAIVERTVRMVLEQLAEEKG